MSSAMRNEEGSDSQGQVTLADPADERINERINERIDRQEGNEEVDGQMGGQMSDPAEEGLDDNRQLDAEPTDEGSAARTEKKTGDEDVAFGRKKTIKDLPHNALACYSCGVAVKSRELDALRAQGVEDATVTIQTAPGPSLPKTAQGGRIIGYTNDYQVQVRFTYCANCREMNAYADELMAQYPRNRARYLRPQDDGGVQLLRAVLAGVGVAGHYPPKITTQHDLDELVEAYAPLADATQYAGRFIHYIESRYKGSASARPWSYLEDESLEGVYKAIKVAYTDWLLAKVTAEMPWKHPEGGGCYICGRAHMMARPKHKKFAWVQTEIIPHAVGGSGREPLKVYVCGLCHYAYREMGGNSWGWRTVEACFFEAMDLNSSVTDFYSFNIQAWGTTGNAPMARPFAFYDLETLREQIERHTPYSMKALSNGR